MTEFRRRLVSSLDMPAGISGFQADNLRKLLAELASRRLEGLSLYEPLPLSQKFHQSRARMRILRGSNRSSKTLTPAVEVARAVTGQDPFHKYPPTDGRGFCIGKDLSHVGDVMWPKLSRPGPFKMIRDLVDGTWRAYRPWIPSDREREHETKKAPPLIPPRLIKEIGWENKKEGIPNIVKLHTGWELNFFSSLGSPPAGSDIDFFWLDEEIVNQSWVAEMQARILDRRGCGFWGATPQAGTEQLFDLHEQAEQQEAEESPRVVEYVFLLENNPHICEEEKRLFAESLSDEERLVRVGGEYAMVGAKVYPDFTMLLHGVDWLPIPSGWSRYAVVDPGYAICAVLFAAVPPPDEGDFVYLYDELYLRKCNAAMFAEAMKRKLSTQDIEAFLIDFHMGKHTELGVGRSIAEQYSDALARVKVKSKRTGSGFIWASDEVKSGLEAVRGWLRPREGGLPKLRVLRDALPNFVREINRYSNRRDAKGFVLDEPNQKRNNHLVDCLRYLALFRPRWIKPRPVKDRLRGSMESFRAKQRRRRERDNETDDGRVMIHLGPGRK